MKGETIIVTSHCCLAKGVFGLGMQVKCNLILEKGVFGRVACANATYQAYKTDVWARLHSPMHAIVSPMQAADQKRK